MNKEKQINSLLNEGDGKRVTEENEKDSHRLQFGHDAVDSHRYIWIVLVALHKMRVLAT